MKKVKLTSVCRPKQWKSIPISELSDVGYPVYGANGVIGYYDSYNHEQETVIITCRGATCGTVNLTHPRSYVTGNAMCLDNVKDSVDIKYLFYSMQAYDFTKVISGTAQPQITQVGLEKVEITLPSLDVQREIVSILDKIDALIEQRRLQLKKLEELVKARFVEMFQDGSSPLKTVEEVCSNIVDCPHTTPKYEGELKNPAIRTSEIKKGFLVWNTMRYVSDDEYLERTVRLIPEAGDIVYGREGAFGNAAILPTGYKFCLGQRVMLLRPDYSKCTSEYLLHAVISDDVYQQAVVKNNASTVAHVNVKDVKQFKVPLPSLYKQKEFATFVHQIDKSKATVQKALDETQLLFDSLMQQYFG